MQSKLLHEAGGQLIFAVILATGDEVPPKNVSPKVQLSGYRRRAPN
jgi:hypothetical protein